MYAARQKYYDILKVYIFLRLSVQWLCFIFFIFLALLDTCIYYMQGGPQNEIYLYRLCIYSYMFKLQSPLVSFRCSTPLRLFSHRSKRFLNSSILMPFSAPAVFCFTSSTSAKHFPLRTFFIQGNQDVLLRARLGEQEGWGTGVMLFLVRNC